MLKGVMKLHRLFLQKEMLEQLEEQSNRLGRALAAGL